MELKLILMYCLCFTFFFSLVPNKHLRLQESGLSLDSCLPLLHGSFPLIGIFTPCWKYFQAAPLVLCEEVRHWITLITH